MRGLTQKIKQTIVMLLVCALAAGNVPLNAFATELNNQENVVEETTLNELLEDNTEESVSYNEEVIEAEIEETVVSGNDIGDKDTVFENEASLENDILISESDLLVDMETENIAGGTITTSVGEVIWNIDSEGKLTVSGKGEVEEKPWDAYKEQIVSAKIELSEMETLTNFFANYTNLVTVDLSGLDTSNVVSINSMFYLCSSLEEVDLSGLDLSKVTEASLVFESCDNLVRVETPKNLTVDISLPNLNMSMPLLYWYELKTDNQYTMLPKEEEESITLLKREKGFGKTVSLTLDSSRYGSELDLTFMGTKENNKQYTYDLKFYYNDTEVENYTSVASFTETEYTTTLPIGVSGAFGGKVSGDVTVYTKAFIDGYEVAKSNEVTIKISDEKLEKVTNVKVNGQVVSWDNVEGASGYYINLCKKTGDNSYTVIKKFNDVKETSLDFSEYSNVAKIDIMALSDDCASKLNSDFVQYTIDSSALTPSPAPVEKNYIVTGNEGSFKEKDGTYTILAGGDYIANVYGEGEKLTPVKATIYNGNKALNWGGIYIEEDDVEFGISSVSFNHLAKSSPKKMSLKIITEGANETAVPLMVYPAIEKITVGGVKKGKATQAYNTQKTYSLKTSPVNMAGILDVVGVNFFGDVEVIKSYKIENGELIIETGERNGSVNVKLYNIAETHFYEEEELNDFYEYIKGGEFTLEVTGPEFTNVKPTVALQDSTNTELLLKVGATGVKTPETGKLWYEVTTEPVNAADEKYGIVSTKNYYPYDEESKVVTVAVADVNNDGNFPAVKNNVKVSLVQTTQETSPDEGGVIQYRTNASKVVTLKNASTKAPNYETNLKLKKGTTKIFTGQQNVVVAIPQFSKNTYFKDLTVTINTEEPRFGNEIPGIVAEYNKEDGKIYVSVDEEEAVAGKYILDVRTVTPAEVKMIRVTMAFEVVYGINTIGFQNVPEYIYKQAGKEASIGIDCTLQHYVAPFEDYTGSVQGDNYVAPKKSSVKFSVVGPDGTELDEKLKNAITIKKNKVVIAKDFNDYNASFAILAEANDYNGNTTKQLLPWNITICQANDQMEKFDKVVIGEWIDVDNDGQTDGLKVVKDLSENKTVSIDDVKGNTFAVLHDDAEVKSENGVDYYPLGQVIDSGVKFTSSSKNVKLDGRGYILGLSKAGKTNITATATDGSGRKLTLKGVDFVGTKENIQVVVTMGEVTSDYQPLTLTESEENEGKYTGEYKGILKHTMLNVTIGDDTICDKGANYKVKISGAKIFAKDISGGAQSYQLIPNKADCVITIENKNTGTTYTYTLQNTVKTEQLTSVAVEGKFVQYYREPGKVTLKLPEKYADKYVKLNVDNAKYTKDMKYADIMQNIDMSPVWVDENGCADICLGSESWNFPAYSGSFKVSVCVGEYDENNSFVPITSTKDTKITVAATKLPKLNTSYTLNLQDTDKVKLTTNTKGMEEFEISKVHKFNSKGQQNKFTDYFEIDANDRSSLKLKDNISLELLEKLYSGKAKEDLKGWVIGTVKVGEVYASQEIQIIINVKNVTAGKITASDICVLEQDSYGVTTVKKTMDSVSSKMDVKHVTASDYLSVWLMENSDIEIYTGSTWQFEPGKTKKVTLYVLDDTAPTAVKSILEYYAENSDWEVNPDTCWEYEEAYKNLIRKFGSKVTTNVTVLKRDKLDEADKLKLAAKSVSLTDKNLSDNCDYVEEVEFTEVIEYVNLAQASVVSVKVGNKDITDSIGQYLTIDLVDDKIKIVLPQWELYELVEAGKLKWKDSLTVSFTFELRYGNYDWEVGEWIEKIYTENETLTIKLPSQPTALG